jgi:hypothetical protein
MESGGAGETAREIEVFPIEQLGVNQEKSRAASIGELTIQCS